MMGRLMRKALFALSAVLVVFVVGRSESVAQTCKAYQLEYYRNTYSSPELCWAGEQKMKGASQECCGAAFGRDPSYPSHPRDPACKGQPESCATWRGEPADFSKRNGD